MRITHVVVTDAFAGTERYVCEVARRQGLRGHDVTVLGGSAQQMRAGLAGTSWHPSASLPVAVARLLADGRRDVVHTHLTAADLAGALAASAHRALHVSTRHIAAPRGQSRLGALSVPLIGRAVDLEIAISRYVAQAAEPTAREVLHNGVTSSEAPYDVAARSVLLLQRLEPEKDTSTALRLWAASGLAEHGWRLVVAGDGSCRTALQREATGIRGISFRGHVDDAEALLRTAGVLLAPAPGEPLGLSVLEAMANGVPVVAAAAGGHLETLPADWPWSFPSQDAQVGGATLRALCLDDTARVRASEILRRRQREHFDMEQHVDMLLERYSTARAANRRGPRAKT